MERNSLLNSRFRLEFARLLIVVIFWLVPGAIEIPAAESKGGGTGQANLFSIINSNAICSYLVIAISNGVVVASIEVDVIAAIVDASTLT